MPLSTQRRPCAGCRRSRARCAGSRRRRRTRGTRRSATSSSRRRLVERELHPVVAARDHLRHQGGVVGGDVVADELGHVGEAHHPVVELDPLVHPPELDVAHAVVDGLEEPLRVALAPGDLAWWRRRSRAGTGRRTASGRPGCARSRRTSRSRPAGPCRARRSRRAARRGSSRPGAACAMHGRRRAPPSRGRRRRRRGRGGGRASGCRACPPVKTKRARRSAARRTCCRGCRSRGRSTPRGPSRARAGRIDGLGRVADHEADVVHPGDRERVG